MAIGAGRAWCPDRAGPEANPHRGGLRTVRPTLDCRDRVGWGVLTAPSGTGGQDLSRCRDDSIFGPEIDHEDVVQDGADDLAEVFVGGVLDVSVAILVAVEGEN